MRRIVLVAMLFMAAACRPRFGGDATGAGSSDGAIQQFLFAAKAQDLQAMSAVWGDAEAPTRDRVDRTEMERRLIIMTCHLRHDESRIGPGQPGAGGTVVHRVELTQGEKKASPAFTTVRNTRSGRWYVADFELESVRTFCRAAPSPTPPPNR